MYILHQVSDHKILTEKNVLKLYKIQQWMEAEAHSYVPN
jgi:hypothetical protein